MPPGGNAPLSIKDEAVAVPPGIVVERFIRDRDGQPVSDLSETDLVALPHWRAEDLDLVPTGIVLSEDKHVFAVRKGENAWLLRLETFLRTQERDVPALLRSSQ
ncbi:hypothetical protein ACOI1H_24110 [Loktanella sp. DJP18]|uniref:hypothetical protein n=1 Tax=Loktanella sp. DJP18 TaxID=3409788 RepID=UPI003BB61588